MVRVGSFFEGGFSLTTAGLVMDREWLARRGPAACCGRIFPIKLGEQCIEGPGIVVLELVDDTKL